MSLRTNRLQRQSLIRCLVECQIRPQYAAAIRVLQKKAECRQKKLSSFLGVLQS